MRSATRRIRAARFISISQPAEALNHRLPSLLHFRFSPFFFPSVNAQDDFLAKCFRA